MMSVSYQYVEPPTKTNDQLLISPVDVSGFVNMRTSKDMNDGLYAPPKPMTPNLEGCNDALGAEGLPTAG